MKFQPPMRAAPPTPTLKPQRIDTGAAVANPVEGRVGHIESYNGVTGVYTLAYHDGHKEEVADADVDRFVVRAAQRSAVDDEPMDLPTDTTEDADPLRLLNAVVHKTVRTYEGTESTVVGTVAAYLPDVDRYRVAYENCLLEDLSPTQAKQLTVRAKRKLNGDTTVDADEEHARKKHNVGTQPPSEPPLNSRPFPSRTVAYTILRKALRAVVAQDVIKKMQSDKQRNILKNEDIRPKKALEHFVDAEGLKLLQRVLVLWMKRTETHAGAMLVLKILAALPGVTAEAVLASNMGKTLSGIKRVSRTMDHVDPALGDLADWVIRSWKRQVPATNSAKILAMQNAAEIKGTTLPALYVAPRTAHRKLKEHESMTLHLRQLMTAPPEPVASSTNDEFFIVEYNKLGSVDKRRPLRQIIHIESLVERVHKKQEELGADDNEDETAAAGEDGRPRLRFRRREEILYFYNTEPYRLRETARSKIVDRRRQRSDSEDAVGVDPPPGFADDTATPKRLPLPNKSLAPAKSILKKKHTDRDVLPQFSHVDWSRTDL